MTNFNLFDTVRLNKDLFLAKGTIVKKGTIGTIVEVYNIGEAYEVELFGGWVEYEKDNLIASHRDAPNSFIETIGVETVYPTDIVLVKTASETVGVRAQLLTILDELSEENLQQIRDFAEFLKQKQLHKILN